MNKIKQTISNARFFFLTVIFGDSNAFSPFILVQWCQKLENAKFVND
jgi:hypothetical protein